jgi:flagellar assembly protein FliH
MSTTKNTASKFTFDTEFLGGESRQTPAARARQKQTLTVEELENLLAAARREGEKCAQAALDRTIAALTISLRAVLDASHVEMEELRNDSACLALAMAKKIAPAALAALPAGDVEAALRQAMHQAFSEPRITLRAAPEVIQALEPSLAGIAQEEGYEGRVQVAADPAMTGADCRIEWRGGGAERSESIIENALTALIAQHFSNQVKG